MTRNSSDRIVPGIDEGGDLTQPPARTEGGGGDGLVWAWRAWDGFWFTPALPHALGLMRICAGLAAFYVAFTYSFDLLGYVSPQGWMDDQAITKLRKQSEIYAPRWAGSTARPTPGPRCWTGGGSSGRSTSTSRIPRGSGVST